MYYYDLADDDDLYDTKRLLHPTPTLGSTTTTTTTSTSPTTRHYATDAPTPVSGRRQRGRVDAGGVSHTAVGDDLQHAVEGRPQALPPG